MHAKCTIHIPTTDFMNNNCRKLLVSGELSKEHANQPLVCHPQVSRSAFAALQPLKLVQQSFFQLPQDDLSSLIF
jgi:hypothetical protein